MSNTSPTFSTEENWLLLQSRYDYIALPMELALQVLKQMKMVTLDRSHVVISEGEVGLKLISGETMAVALVKSKLLPPEEKEE